MNDPTLMAGSAAPITTVPDGSPTCAWESEE